ncbi:MAG: glutaminyl-peptide cyclotransferase [Flavobacteriaceae bacterium]|nr:glutaminyl-peptide cyclotransferase [Flavobacteriaceae bacterium]
MSSKLYFFPIALLLIMISCKTEQGHQGSDFSITTNVRKNVVPIGQPLSISIENSKGHKIDSVRYFIHGRDYSNGAILSGFKLGKQQLEAEIYYDNTSERISTNLTILNNKGPVVYNFEVLNSYPHDITSYTQGLEFHNGRLYESTGQLGESKLRAIDHKTGDILQNIDLKADYFGEGLTITNNKVFQLTWRSGMGLIYDLPDLQRLGSFKYGNSKEGWGLCHDDNYIYKSDGTENIWLLDPDTLKEVDRIQVYTHKGKIVGLNELEWINGKIYANRYQKNGVAIINPVNGAIEGVIDFSPLRKKVKQHAKLDVLNGIAFNPESQTIFVTGKNWDTLFEVEIVD